MQSIKNIIKASTGSAFIKGLLIASFVLAFLSVPIAQAAYDCTVSYSGSDVLSPFTYDACCYPQNPDREPYQGMSCRPEGQYMMMGPTRCVSGQVILDLATATRTQNKVGFNCKDGSIKNECRDAYCKNNSGTCIARTGVACSVASRVGICPGGCGGCKGGYTYCVNNQPTNIPDQLDELSGSFLSCQANKTGSEFAANGGKTCEQLGKNVANLCTGECTSCPDGKTPSGRTPGACVSYAQRFGEMFDDGFTYFGGKFNVTVGGVSIGNLYSYGSVWDKPKSSDPNNGYFYGDVFVDVDQADNLNWASPTVPAVLQSMLASAGYQFCSASTDPANTGCSAGQVCTAGICNKPDAGTGTSDPGDIGQFCKDANNRPNSSLCHMGLLCDSNTLKCINPSSPENELAGCTDNSQCTSPATCVLGYCHNQTNGPGAPCTGSDSECAAGLICNDSKICVSATDTTARFVGLSTATSNGIATIETYVSYNAANKICSNAYSGSHVCFPSEMIDSYIANVPTLASIPANPVTKSWLNSATPANTQPAINDCDGWQKGANPFYGTVWNFTTKSARIQPCLSTLKFACCK